MAIQNNSESSGGVELHGGQRARSVSGSGKIGCNWQQPSFASSSDKVGDHNTYQQPASMEATWYSESDPIFVSSTSTGTVMLWSKHFAADLDRLRRRNTLQKFSDKLKDSMRDQPAEIGQLVEENFWDLF